MDITVIICIYNSNHEKIKNTIKSVCCQKNIDYEVLVADDGSKKDDTLYIKELFRTYKFSNYKILRSQVNKGTVRNILNALLQASGTYVFLTSPGDLIYDDTTLHGFYHFAKERGLKFIFGDAVYYSAQKGNIKLYEIAKFPSKPQLFQYKSNPNLEKLAILKGYNICGASFLREREAAIDYIKKILDTTKYVEDTTSSLAYVMDGKQIIYYDQKVVCYECGEGISTNGNSEWQQKINDEIRLTKDEIIKSHPNDKVVEYLALRNSKKYTDKIKARLKHPIIHYFDYKINHSPICYSKESKEDINKIKSLIVGSDVKI